MCGQHGGWPSKGTKQGCAAHSSWLIKDLVFETRHLDGRELPATAGVWGNALRGWHPPSRPSQAQVAAQRTGQTLGARGGPWNLGPRPNALARKRKNSGQEKGSELPWVTQQTTKPGLESGFNPRSRGWASFHPAKVPLSLHSPDPTSQNQSPHHSTQGSTLHQETPLDPGSKSWTHR